MNIKSKLNSISRGLWSTLIIASIFFTCTFISIDKALTQDRYVAKTLIYVSGLSSYLSEFILQQDSQTSLNWDIEHQKLAIHLKNKPLMSWSTMRYMNVIEKRQAGVISLFDHLQRLNFNKSSTDIKTSINMHIVYKIFIQMESILEDSIRLTLIAKEETKRVFLYRGAFFALVVLVAIFSMMSLSKNIFRELHYGLKVLTDGTILARNGEFNQPIKEIPAGEFGVVAKHFNSMLAHLKETTVSRDLLQSIVEKRTKQLIMLSETD